MVCSQLLRPPVSVAALRASGSAALPPKARRVCWIAAHAPQRSPRRSDAGKIERAVALRRLKIKLLRTKPYTPRTNGKAERFIQTALREWAYAFRYPSSTHRADELAPCMHHYNFHLGHGTLASCYANRLCRDQCIEKLHLVCSD